MRITRVVSLTSVGVALSACTGERATNSVQQDEFQRDLQLASAMSMDLAGVGVDSALLNAMETKPAATPQPATTLRKAPGNRAVRSQNPTVRATPVAELAESDESLEVVQTLATAPVPEPITEPVAVAPRPTAPPIVDAGGNYGTGNGGVFGGGSGGGGVVIRGGGVGEDRCELHWPRRPQSGNPVIIRRVPPNSGPIAGGGFPVGGIGSSGMLGGSAGGSSRVARPRETVSNRPDPVTRSSRPVRAVERPTRRPESPASSANRRSRLRGQ